MILYPTETVYGLGVNALDPVEVEKLNVLKGRPEEKKLSWLVRTVDDIAEYAEVNDTARAIISEFLPGPLTLVLQVNTHALEIPTVVDGRVRFRISPDPVAQTLIERFMAEHNAPLTCTSANISGMPTLSTPHEILTQFGERASLITEVIDDGPRQGTPSTVVGVFGSEVEVYREGSISTEALMECVR